jgi:hypothetical protein
LNIIDLDKDSYITGMGTSSSHARYLSYLLNKYLKYNTQYIPYGDLLTCYKDIPSVIIFSQGISPHIRKLLKLFENKKKIVNTSSNDCSEKTITLTNDIEKQTLIRIHGPFKGFLLSWKLIEYLSKTIIFPDLDKIFNKMFFFEHLIHEAKLPDLDYFSSLMISPAICIITNYPMLHFMDNIKMKFIEGCFFDRIMLVEQREFIHGTYQLLETKRREGEIYHFIWFDNQYPHDTIRPQISKLLEPYKCWKITSDLPQDLKILEYELIINSFVLQIMNYLEIDQSNWSGKQQQHLVYDH